MFRPSMADIGTSARYIVRKDSNRETWHKGSAHADPDIESDIIFVVSYY